VSCCQADIAAISRPSLLTTLSSFVACLYFTEYCCPVTSSPKSHSTSIHFLHFCSSFSFSSHFPLSCTSAILKPHIVHSLLHLCAGLPPLHFILCSSIHKFLFPSFHSYCSSSTIHST
jgi:hypothetical protein